jgi:rfaE bifunctional protein nucleotidyltransferase chain/domain
MRNPNDKIHSSYYSNSFYKDHTVVFVSGCFDLLHYSHVDFLQRARTLGDYLLVGINSDYSVKQSKPGRPIIPQKWRLRQLAALECVDEVFPFNEPTPIKAILTIKPKIVVAGLEWLIRGVDVGNSGATVVYLPESEDHISTTALIERLKSVPKEETNGNSIREDSSAKIS